MLLNILYYDQMNVAKNGKQLNGLTIGPFYFSREQVCHCICIIENIFVFPPDRYRNNGRSTSVYSKSVARYVLSKDSKSSITF